MKKQRKKYYTLSFAFLGTRFLAALSSSRSLVVGPLVRWSVGPLVGP